MAAHQQELVLTRGIPASGKSTWAMQWVAEDPQNRVRINRDDLRLQLFGVYVPLDENGKIDVKKEEQVSVVEAKLIDRAFREGKSVVSDNTHMDPKRWKSYTNIAAKYSIPVRTQDFPVTLAEAKRRNRARDRFVEEFVLDRMFAKTGPNGEFHHFDGSYPVKPLVAPSERRHAFGFDMDGTLSDTRPITHYVRGKRRDFDMFHRSSIFTKPNAEVLQLAFDAHDAGLAVIITTARNEAYREVTQKWLDDLGVPYENIFMRKDGDYRPDYVVKTEILETQIKPWYDLVRMADDNVQAVAAWRDAGIPVTVVPGFGDPDVVSNWHAEQPLISIENVFASGKCARCGRALKGEGPLGPECRKIQ